MKSKKASSFHEFARSTSDAWDIGDDEDEDFSSSSSSSSLQTLNSKVAKATAAQVLENHSKLRAKPERCQPALGDLPTNCKVIKSSSEAQLSRSSGKNHLQEQLKMVLLNSTASCYSQYGQEAVTQPVSKTEAFFPFGILYSKEPLSEAWL